MPQATWWIVPALGRHLGVLGGQRRVGGRADDELVVEPLGIAEAERVAVARDAVHALGGQALLPEVERLRGGDAPHDAVHHPRAGAAGLGARVLEEGEVEARLGVLVAVEEVVDGRVVLVDGLLDESKAHHADVEVHVALGVARDRGDVVDAVELHA